MGNNCEIPIKQCSLCLNGGECEPQVPTRCKCKDGFTGIYLFLKFNLGSKIDSRVCQKVNANVFNFLGSRCEQCIDLRCQNGGTCVSSLDGVKKCICSFGYSGQVCNMSKCDNYCKKVNFPSNQWSRGEDTRVALYS